MIYGNAMAMGLSPLDVDRMSLAQWLAAQDGWIRVHGEDAPPEMSTERFLELLETYG